MSYQIQEFKVNDSSAYLTGVDFTLNENKDTNQPASCKSISMLSDKNCFIYPYKNRKFYYEFNSIDGVHLYFSGFNVKILGKKTLEYSIETIQTDLNQSSNPDQYIKIGDLCSFVFSLEDYKFYLRDNPLRIKTTDVVICSISNRNITYMHSSLLNYFTNDNLYLKYNNQGFFIKNKNKLYITYAGFTVMYNNCTYCVRKTNSDNKDDFYGCVCFDLYKYMIDNNKYHSFLVIDMNLMYNSNASSVDFDNCMFITDKVQNNQIIVAYMNYYTDLKLYGDFKNLFDNSLERVFHINGVSGSYIKHNIVLNKNTCYNLHIENPDDLGNSDMTDEQWKLGIQLYRYDEETEKFIVIKTYFIFLKDDIPPKDLLFNIGNIEFDFVAVGVRTEIGKQISFSIIEVLNNVKYYFIYNNDGYIRNNLSNVNIVSKNRMTISPNGFGVVYNNNVYYIADVTKTRQYDYVFDFDKVIKTYLCIDIYKLTNINGRNELSDVITIIEDYDMNYLRYIPIAYKYMTDSIRLLSPFKDLFERNNTYDNYYTYNKEVLFAPEFYAYYMGRYNNENGVGISWYKRFNVCHITDVHHYIGRHVEALKVANEYCNVIVNSGDDANGNVSTSKDTMLATLSDCKNNVDKVCDIDYIITPGNHDVTNLTKQDYFDLMYSDTSNFVFGDAENYRVYGYIDYTDNSYEGNFRIITLDPFDYDDGSFPDIRAFQSVTFSQKQIDWLIDTLIDAAENDLNVITVMHYSFGDSDIMSEDNAKPDATYYQDPFMIPDIIDALQNSSIINKTYNDSKNLYNININRDFSNVPKLKYICHLFGHIHSKNKYQCKKSDGSKNYNMLMLGEKALGCYGNALNKIYTTESGTSINNIAFSVLSIDVIEKTIYRVSYGAYRNYDKSNSERTEKISYTF